MTARPNDLWLRTYREVRRPRLRLVCFPHAGGAASTYRTWPRYLPYDVQLMAACYPGREGRLVEAPIDRMELLVEPFLDALRPLSDVPMALFGHSMGASVAHELTIRLQDVPGAAPVGLFVSGRVPPQLLAPSTPTGAEDDDVIVREILRLGHGNAEVFADPELRSLILPAIRADFHLTSTYHPGLRPPLSLPVFAYGGDADPDVTPEDLRLWSTATHGPFTHRIFPGGHFYLERHERVLVGDVADRLTALAPVAVPRWV
jgi:pyochelin biosynthetic protein PchC